MVRFVNGVYNVVQKGGAILSSRTAYSAVVTSVTNSRAYIKIYMIPIARPKTPGSVYNPKLATEALMSATVIGNWCMLAPALGSALVHLGVIYLFQQLPTILGVPVLWLFVLTHPNFGARFLTSWV